MKSKKPQNAWLLGFPGILEIQDILKSITYKLSPKQTSNVRTIIQTFQAAKVHPNIIAAASANGERDWDNILAGIIPEIDTELNIYTIAANKVPHKVARGMLRFGFKTQSDGTVADSTPTKAHKVKDTPAEKTCKSLEPVRLGVDVKLDKLK